jgi:uncharacterized protein (DUF433 family)
VDDDVIGIIERAVNDQVARVTFGGDPGQYVQAIAWNASRAAARELARQGLVNNLGPGHHAMVTVDEARNHGRASITRRMVPIWSPVGLLRAGDPVEVIREEFDLTEAEAAVVAALGEDLADLATGAAHDQLRDVYRERARLVAVLASLFPSVWAYSDPAAPEWPVVYVHTPKGQCSWHLSQDDLDLFGHVPQVPADDARARWNGHSTEEKYRRLAELARDGAEQDDGDDDSPPPELDTCRPVQVTVDGQEEIVRVHGAEPMDEQDRAALAELVAATRRHVQSTKPHLGVQQELIMACLAAMRCIPDGEVRRGCTVTDGAKVKARLKAAVTAAREALTPTEEGGTSC